MLLFLGLIFRLFFFSSRRRHTRYWRDWSSDVCSSDLPGQNCILGPARGCLSLIIVDRKSDHLLRHERSEERRVGKECRSRWLQYHLKKNKGYGSKHQKNA